MNERVPVAGVGPETPAGALASVESWGVPHAAAAVVDTRGVLATPGDIRRPTEVASLTKLVTAWAVLVAVEERSVDLADPAGPPGSTVAHLLAHASGLDFDTPRVMAAPGTRRIYSNAGYEALGAHLEQATGIGVVDYVTEAVLVPLGMSDAALVGSPAAGLVASVVDFVAFTNELRSPTLVHPSTAAVALAEQFAGLAGVVPGWGRFDPCPWGFGPEIRGAKSPHWMGATAPANAIGHFGGSGSFCWLDPGSGLALVVVGDRPFGDWAVACWPAFSDAVRRGFLSTDRVLAAH